ncbi:MAG: hypothetical protein GF398_09800 [Chitinivibrionales bacterium]|nr:hypothetical protein [Chitinivibrionales bacterium]
MMKIPQKLSAVLTAMWLSTVVFSAGARASIERIALVVGANRGLVNERPLQYAESDARRVHTIFEELGNVKPGHNYLLASPSIKDFERRLYEIAGRVKEIRENGGKVELLFYYSGHGGADVLHIGGRKIAVDHVLELLEESKADLKIIVVDACYSGSFLKRKGGTVAPAINVAVNEELQAEGTIILTSSSEDQISHESLELKGSVFTHYFTSGIRGAADIDRDGKVGLAEGFNFARLRTSRELLQKTGKFQEPNFRYDFEGSGQVILTWLNQGSCKLKIVGGKAVPHYIVSQTTQNVYAEFIPFGDTLTLALPKDNYFVNRLSDRTIGYQDADLSFKREMVLNLTKMQTYPRTAMNRKGSLFMNRPSRNRAEVFYQLFQGYPQERTIDHIGGVSYTWQASYWRIGVKAGYGQDRLSSIYWASVDRQIVVMGASLGRTMFNHKFIALDLEGGLGVHHVTQQKRYYDHDLTVRLTGLTRPRVLRSVVPYAEALLSASARVLPWLNVSVAGGGALFAPEVENTGVDFYARPLGRVSFHTNF